MCAEHSVHLGRDTHLRCLCEIPDQRALHRGTDRPQSQQPLLSGPLVAIAVASPWAHRAVESDREVLMHRIQGRPHIYQSSQSEMLVTTLDDSARTVGCLNRRRNTMLNTHLKLAAAALLASVAFIGSAHAQVVGESSRSEEHTSELQSLMRISYAVF